ncbi:hypothetical protein [Geminocystis sp. NIES-3709]|uniref:hypothetical protein n=1 Tax=Geminocystis sp. NIES-3709 TaxID=1617448 RepID=UPI0005FC89FF|nr:hypothetical protein [Geminocystis sp. NIES-3709]BAQ63947.1 hypothetical protein GM3709_712 [Geminocystis sp. NIES-3709]
MKTLKAWGNIQLNIKNNMRHILFNFCNVCNVTWLDRKDIKMITIKSNDHCLVTLKTGETLKVTANEVKESLEQTRKKRSSNIEIIDNPDYTYTARNPIKETQYTLITKDSYIYCTCPDYNNQSIALKSDQVCCKHIWSLLEYLGFNSLLEYKEYIETEQIEAEYQKYLDREFYDSYGNY